MFIDLQLAGVVYFRVDKYMCLYSIWLSFPPVVGSIIQIFSEYDVTPTSRMARVDNTFENSLALEPAAIMSGSVKTYDMTGMSCWVWNGLIKHL